ncbi:MAG: hypothetical protein M3Y85_04270 [Bacteroidota bacterium]|nr:hypothetical protein [Bacteroidota bacterium]
MKLLIEKSRALLSLLIIIAFFIPAYKDNSAFSFISLALSEVNTNSDITIIDVYIFNTLLILIPLTALAVFITSLMRKSVRQIVIVLPFLLLVFTLAVLATSEAGGNNLSVLKLFAGLKVGFYLAAVSSFSLMFTKNRSRRRHRRKKYQAQTKVAIQE